ncbi:MAG: hypothetical protein RQ743_12370, partial [Bacteroidales bacterium]|nr:hypothetical protein [Bacteroidales bacterium]
FAALLAGLVACEKEYAPPVLTSPGSETIETASSVDLSFNYTADGGFKSSSVSATNGSAVIKSNGTSGETSGVIVITFTAGNTSGAGSVTLNVSDAQDQTASAMAVIDIINVPTVSVYDNIAADETWEKGNVYILEGRIAVLDGVTLTIEPGVIIKGEAGSGSNATALLIARGATLIAEGTAQEPIIFTSVADQILPGEVASPNMDPTTNGLWGGLLVLGKAPISADAPAVGIEGIPASDLNGLYGGDDETDNSGILKYISIRHGGANIGEGNEINGLTLGGVGSGTVIENIEIVANQDDGIEWFGGKVDVNNIVVWNTGDDAIDADQSWGGTADNIIIVNPGDECFELDGPEGTMEDKYTLKNVSAYAGADTKGLVDNDDNTWVDMENIYFFGMDPTIGQSFDQIPTVYTCTFTNFEATIPAGSALTDFFLDGSDAFTTAVAAGQNTVGADKSAFDGWSWAAVSGSLSNF